MLFIIAQCFSVMLLPFFLWWITYAALNGIGPGWQAAMAAVSTSPDEARGAISMALHIPQVVLFSCACCVCLTLSIILTHWKQARLATEKVSKNRLQLACVLALFPFFFSFSNNATGAHFPVLFMASDPGYSPIGTATRLIWEGADQVMYGDILTVGVPRMEATSSRKIRDARLSIFVIGESMRAGGIGPEKILRGPWTKALNDRVRNNLGTWLPPTCAGSNGTAVSVPLLLTGLPPSRYKESESAPSVLAILHKSGYKTAWISNQDNNVFFEQGHDYYWSISRSASVSDTYDEQLVPVALSFVAPLINKGTTSVGPYAMILHMHGSHFNYVDRYPAAQFPVEPVNLSDEARVDLEYERSEEYSAKVINDLAALLDASAAPAFLLYSSDHGENLPSDHNGVITHLGPRATLKDGTTTTFVLWNSAMQLTGRPAVVLSQINSRPAIAHVDVAKIYLALAGMSDGPVIAHSDPEILAPVELNGRSLQVNLCSQLEP